ncbi:S41 family peptidase [Geodermatophilus sp. CPCC 205761]|uniref:S41 family peptidase n=1 Tax=Geodermatophilus sp. CPCC 205761 TaxID=2936597 RepID=UPI003EED657C
MTGVPRVELAEDHPLGAVRTMPEFRAGLAEATMSEADRRLLVEQAEALVDGVYVHLPLKRAMHAIDPEQSLRLLRHRLATMSDAAFHRELLRIFQQLRDLHTNYILPAGYEGFAFLGIFVERYRESGEDRWLVSQVYDHIVGDPHLVRGAEITHWNGVPMAIAVERNAEREAGSNPAARRARGLENMTMRPVRMSLPPDEDWVELTYRVPAGDGGSTTHETRVPWRVFASAQEVRDFGVGVTAAAPSTSRGTRAGALGTGVDLDHLVGLDLRTELTRRAKREFFAPESLAEEERVRSAAEEVPPPTEGQAEAGVIPTTRPAELRARVITTSSGRFGHLRIFTFFMADRDIEAFLDEVVRLLAVLPEEGLVLDVRGNGGGYVIAAEFLLQFLTPQLVQPEPMQFVTTPGTAQLCAAVDDYASWRRSIDESVETGAQYSSAIPLYPTDLVNSVGQLYHGPVVLVTDALCYSATDIFSAGFQDHGIGRVLGVDQNTGAGGANVVQHGQLLQEWTGGPLRALPGGADFRVALRRSLRVGARAGQPVEDLGVVPDEVHELTRRDLLGDNEDLMAHAGRILAGSRPRRLSATAGVVGATLRLTLETRALSSVDVYVDGRPAVSSAVTDGTTEVDLPTAAAPTTVRLAGFDGDQLVAGRVLRAR